MLEHQGYTLNLPNYWRQHSEDKVSASISAQWQERKAATHSQTSTTTPSPCGMLPSLLCWSWSGTNSGTNELLLRAVRISASTLHHCRPHGRWVPWAPDPPAGSGNRPMSLLLAHSHWAVQEQAVTLRSVRLLQEDFQPTEPAWIPHVLRTGTKKFAMGSHSWLEVKPTYAHSSSWMCHTRGLLLPDACLSWSCRNACAQFSSLV